MCAQESSTASLAMMRALDEHLLQTMELTDDQRARTRDRMCLCLDSCLVELIGTTLISAIP